MIRGLLIGMGKPLVDRWSLTLVNAEKIRAQKRSNLVYGVLAGTVPGGDGRLAFYRLGQPLLYVCGGSTERPS
jgi:hypothetical protein